MFTKSLFTICCSLMCYLLLAQSATINSTDSNVFKKATEAFAISFRNADSALQLAFEALRQSKAINNLSAEANARNSIGWAYHHKGHFDSALTYLTAAHGLFLQARSKEDVARVCINLAEVYTKQNQLASAIGYLLQADSLSKRIALLTDIKRQLAIVYREAGDLPLSAGYFKQDMDGFSTQQDYFRYVNTGVSLSILYRKMKLPDSSLAILNRCLQIAREKKGSPYQLAMTEENIAETLFGQANYNEALLHYSRAYNTFEKINNMADLAYEAFSIGKTFAKLNQPASAEKFLLRSYQLNDSLKMINYQQDAATELSELYKNSGDWQKAYSYLAKAAELKDSINANEQVAKARAIKEKYETEKKEQQIQLLQTRNELAAVDYRRTKLLQYIFILLFAAAVVIGWLLFNRLRTKRILKEQLLRNQIAGDLHDDIGSTLSSIDISSRIALLKKNDAAAVEEQLTKIRQHAKKTMDRMSDIVWSINPHYDNFESILSRMREFAAEVCEPQQISLHFSLPEQVQLFKPDADQRKHVFLLFKEAVNNAAKYSNCSNLGIYFSDSHPPLLVMRIQDDGMGFDKEMAVRGNGLRSMQSRALHLGGQLTIASDKNKGTSIELKCPL